jgi:hypothetical protein
MAITGAVCNSYKGEILGGVTQHSAGDVYKIALFTSAATLDKTTTAYSATNEVVGAGYSAGGATLASFAVTQVGDRWILTFADPAWAASTLVGRGALIYNSSKANRAVAVINFGSDITSTNGTFTVDLGNAIASGASITFTTNNTISRAAGSFVTDGFQVGHTIVTNDTANPGPFTIATVVALTITTVETTVTTVAQATKTVAAVVVGL